MSNDDPDNNRENFEVTCSPPNFEVHINDWTFSNYEENYQGRNVQKIK